MEVDIALEVSVGNILWKQGQSTRLGNSTSEKVTLGGEDVGVLVGVLVNQGVVVVDQASHSFVDVASLGALDVAVQAVGSVGAGHVVGMLVDQRVLDEVLDVLNMHWGLEALEALLLDVIDNLLDDGILVLRLLRVDVAESTMHCANDVFLVEVHNATVSFGDAQTFEAVMALVKYIGHIFQRVGDWPCQHLSHNFSFTYAR